MRTKLRLFVALVLLAPSCVLADSVISIQPSTGSVALGGNLSLEVNIAGVTDLYAFQFDVDFDPTTLSATGISEGPFLLTGGPTFFIPGTIDNVGGVMAFNADTLIGAVPGVTGSGDLATLDFTAIANGASSVSLSNVILLDSNFNSIPFTTESAQIEPTQEPGTLFLLMTGLIVMAIVGVRNKEVRSEFTCSRSSVL
jgi:hypothetical protein